MRLTYVASWSHRCLLRRPQKEDRRSRRKRRHEKERGRPSVRGEPLLSQALREEISPRKVAFTGQSTRQTPEDRRACQEPAGSRPQGAAFAKLRQRCEYLEALAGLRVSRSALCRTLKRMGFTRKKGQWVLVSETNG